MSWTWSLRNPDGGMNGLEFATATTAEDQQRVLVHAAPEQLEIVVRDKDDKVVARGKCKASGEDTPMSEITLSGSKISRTEVWPTDEHNGLVVILPGGEAGVLKQWHTADDKKSWRWTLELSNQV
jgi:hypothetical protein